MEKWRSLISSTALQSANKSLLKLQSIDTITKERKCPLWRRRESSPAGASPGHRECLPVEAAAHFVDHHHHLAQRPNHRAADRSSPKRRGWWRHRFLRPFSYQQTFPRRLPPTSAASGTLGSAGSGAGRCSPFEGLVGACGRFYCLEREQC